MKVNMHFQLNQSIAILCDLYSIGTLACSPRYFKVGIEHRKEISQGRMNKNNV